MLNDSSQRKNIRVKHVTIRPGPNSIHDTELKMKKA